MATLLKICTDRMGRRGGLLLGMVALVVAALLVIRQPPPTPPAMTPHFAYYPAAASPAESGMGAGSAMANLNELAAKRDRLTIELQSEPIWQATLQQIQDRMLELDERFRQVTHEQCRSEQWADGTGKLLSAQQLIDRVHYVPLPASTDGDTPPQFREVRQRLSDKQLHNDSVAKLAQEAMTKFNQVTAIYPFSRESQPNGYTYRFDCVDLWPLPTSEATAATKTPMPTPVPTRCAVRLAFVPEPPLSGKYRGHFWADADTGVPLRWEGIYAEKTIFVDSLHLTVDFQLEPTLQQHLIHKVTTRVQAGFAFVRRQVLVTVDFRNYQDSSTTN